MIYQSIDGITEEDIVSLVSNQVPESSVLDYKTALPLDNDDGKREFLRDVTAFANTNGGNLIYGIAEEERDGVRTGLPSDLIGVDSFVPNEFKLWAENLIRDCIAPRLLGVEIKDVPLQNGNTLIVVRVGKSWNSPHVVRHGKHWRFYARNSAGNYQMDVTQLRDAFSLGGEIIERLRAKREALLESVRYKYQKAKQTPVPTLVLHIQPLDAVRPDHRVDVTSTNGMREMLKLGDRHDGAFKFNFDGVRTEYGQDYLQIYHSGITEEVLTSMFGGGDKGPYIDSKSLSWSVAKSIGARLKLLKVLGVTGPVLIGIALLGIVNYKLISLRAIQGEAFELPIPQLPDRDDLVAEPIFVESIANLNVEGMRSAGKDEIPNCWEAAAVVIRPAMNSIWNGYGVERCFEYNANGVLVGYVSAEDVYRVNPSQVW